MRMPDNVTYLAFKVRVTAVSAASSCATVQMQTTITRNGSPSATAIGGRRVF